MHNIYKEKLMNWTLSKLKIFLWERSFERNKKTNYRIGENTYSKILIFGIYKELSKLISKKIIQLEIGQKISSAIWKIVIKPQRDIITYIRMTKYYLVKTSNSIDHAENWITLTLLIRMWNGIAIKEKAFGTFLKSKNSFYHTSYQFITRHLSQKH